MFKTDKSRATPAAISLGAPNPMLWRHLGGPLQSFTISPIHLFYPEKNRPRECWRPADRFASQLLAACHLVPSIQKGLGSVRECGSHPAVFRLLVPVFGAFRAVFLRHSCSLLRGLASFSFGSRGLSLRPALCPVASAFRVREGLVFSYWR